MVIFVAETGRGIPSPSLGGEQPDVDIVLMDIMI